jgi:hypothetical protein
MCRVFIFLNTYDGPLRQKREVKAKEENSKQDQLRGNKEADGATSTSGATNNLQKK